MASSSTSSDYGVRRGKLKLKGAKQLGLTGASAKRKRKAADESDALDVDAETHGGWRQLTEESQMRAGPVAVEAADGLYLQSMDNGKFTIGAPHGRGDAPLPEEILTLIRTPDTAWVTLKSGYGKFVGVNSEGQMVALAEAAGAREKWEFVFDQGKVALQSLSNNCFVATETDKDGYVYASSKVARENEMIRLRTNQEKAKPADWRPDEDKKQSRDCEVAYVKKYQHSKANLNPDAAAHIKHAKGDGTLHEILLDRRVQMKSDKYCK